MPVFLHTATGLPMWQHTQLDYAEGEDVGQTCFWCALSCFWLLVVFGVLFSVAGILFMVSCVFFSVYGILFLVCGVRLSTFQTGVGGGG